MNRQIDETHDPALESWVESANAPETDFPIQNLPFGRFRRQGDARFSIGVAIGDQVLDLKRAALIDTDDMRSVMSAERFTQQALRHAVSRAMRHDSPRRDALRQAIVAQAVVELALPCEIGDYTDFYTSIHHATTVGRQF